MRCAKSGDPCPAHSETRLIAAPLSLQSDTALAAVVLSAISSGFSGQLTM